jgi:hypothetical protein
MAKAINKNKVDIENLSEKDRDILTLEVKNSMKKYKLGKQAVYDKRHYFSKKIHAGGLTVEQVLSDISSVKKVRPKKEKAVEEPIVEKGELLVIADKNVPVIMKPIEINFDNFSIKLNGVPKKISVNPETNAIEIDLSFSQFIA